MSNAHFSQYSPLPYSYHTMLNNTVLYEILKTKFQISNNKILLVFKYYYNIKNSNTKIIKALTLKRLNHF